jgi:hypothetical protein
MGFMAGHAVIFMGSMLYSERHEQPSGGITELLSFEMMAGAATTAGEAECSWGF